MKKLEQEFANMIKEYRKVIFNVCYFYSEDAEEVKDLFQDILINLWTGFPKFRGDSSFKTWIWKVSLNTCNNYVRKAKRSIKTLPLSMDIDLYNDTDEKSKQIQMLYERINRLEPFDRAIILLWLENMNYDEIAQIVGISLSCVTTKLHRIKEQLKSMSNH